MTKTKYVKPTWCELTPSYASKSRRKIGLAGTGLLIILALCIVCVGLGQFLAETPEKFASLQHWLSTNALYFLGLRLGLLTLVYFTWPYYIRKIAKKHHYSNVMVKHLIKRRYWMALILIGIDILLHL